MYDYEDSYEETGIDENVVQDALFGMLWRGLGGRGHRFGILPGQHLPRRGRDVQRRRPGTPHARRLEFQITILQSR